MGNIASAFALLLLSLLHHLLILHAAEDGHSIQPTCPQSFECGTLGSFHFPFTNQTYAHCGIILIYCDEEARKVQLGASQYNLTGMTNDNSFEVYDQALQNYPHKGDCRDTFKEFTLSTLPFISFTILHNLTFFRCSTGSGNASETEDYFHGGYTTYRNCTDNSGYTIYYEYPGDSGSVRPSLPHNCSAIQLPVLAPWRNPDPSSPFNLLSPTFSLKYHVSDDCNDCYHRGGQCSNDGQNFLCLISNEEGSIRNLVVKVAIAILSAGVVIIIMLFCLFWRKFTSSKSPIIWKKEISNHQNIESFLKNHGSLGPKRFTYSQIERMTCSFKYKLGEGGYGGVYKGRLQNGQLVAVKVLKESKGNGEEFTNEVASISKTAHVNIVTLLGFCFEGSKRALVYEFMANGSLEKFIHVQNSWGRRKLDWDILYQIAVGIAQGLDYLHRGCSTRILHFDIKPHNILLDEEFCPKISDFGLSKLCPKKESIVSMLVARGTIGYIAPEVFSRSFGGVSHKSDVYSYGMMVLEMVGGRKNIKVGVDRTSELYFPYWIYKCMQLNEDFGLYDATNEEENERARKMIIVGLWCIQVDPSNRPSISRVVDMFEGSLESLQMPPKPVLSSPPRAPADSSTTVVQ